LSFLPGLLALETSQVVEAEERVRMARAKGLAETL
jgi:hypothetical protein